MNIIVLIFLITLIILLIISLCNCKCRDYFAFNPNKRNNKVKFNFKAETPINALTSNIVDYPEGSKLPDMFVYLPSKLSPVRNQGDCGACYAFVINSVLSDQITIRIINFQKNLNTEQLLSCYNPKAACEGSAIEDVLKWIIANNFQIGISDEYHQGVSQCVMLKQGITVVPGSIRALSWYVKSQSMEIENMDLEEQWKMKESINNMEMELVNYGPFFVGIAAYEDFFAFSGKGVYRKSENTRFVGGHALQVVGYVQKGIDKRPGYEEAYWLCKNSYGTDWAPESDYPGYFCIAKGRNECRIESLAESCDPNVEFDPSIMNERQTLFVTNYDKYMRGEADLTL